MPGLEIQNKANIFFQDQGQGDTALIFVHGWLGNSDWWRSQIDFFSECYRVIAIDLPGHGKSPNPSGVWSCSAYAAAINAGVDALGSQTGSILVAHSMAGAFALEAAHLSKKVKAIVLVDTLKDLDQLMTYEQAESLVLGPYRADFKDAVENLLPKFLFAPSTPVPVQNRLTQEFLQYEGNRAVEIIAPLYKADIRSLAQRVEVPVRAINSDMGSTNTAVNRKYFKDYDVTLIHGTGHYPMLEQPDEFNAILDKVLTSLLRAN